MIRRIIGIAILLGYLLARILNAPEWFFWMYVLAGIIAVIVDYYWFSGRSFESGEE